ncbi:MAG: peroxiredoxin family protein [Planctomycetota bacterium]
MTPPRFGDPAPDFTAKTPHDIELSLGALLERGTLVVEFLRGTWDPNSRDRIFELSAARAQLAERNALVLLVSCEPIRQAKEFIEKGDLPLRLVADSDRELSRQFGVYQKFSFGAIHVARASTFIIDRAAYVRFAHVGSSPIDAAPLEKLLAELQAIADESKRAGR